MDASRLEQLVAKVLKEELREDENTREQSLEQFRDWILKNPDIRDCPTDDNFLLRFLRFRKYSIPMAEQTLTALLKFQQNFPSFHENLDIEDPDINGVITSGFLITSPFQENNGQIITVCTSKNLDLKKHNFETVARAVILHCHTLAQNEASQVLGVTAILDYSQVSPAFFAMCPLAVLKSIAECLEQMLPVHTNRIHIINLPNVATCLFKMVLSMLSETTRKKVVFHSSLEELYDHIDRRVLPKEYGGTMPMIEMIGLWKKKMAVHRESILAINNTKLAGNSFKNDLGSNNRGIPDMPGSFRTLAVD